MNINRNLMSLKVGMCKIYKCNIKYLLGLSIDKIGPVMAKSDYEMFTMNCKLCKLYFQASKGMHYA